MAERQRISSGSPFEGVFGFSRAVRAGDRIFVSGTVAWSEAGELVGAGDMYAQAKQAIGNIEAALREAGASLSDVVRTRMFVTDITRLGEVARAHSETFGEVRPAATLVAVSALAAPELLVEIEADAVV